MADKQELTEIGDSQKKRVLLSQLLHNTQEKKLVWEKTGQDDLFATSLPPFVLRISRLLGGTREGYYIRIFNADGELVDEISNGDFQGLLVRDGVDMLAQTYRVARASAMGASQALDQLLQGLQQLPSR